MAHDWVALCRKFGLELVDMSKHIYGGRCPVCERDRAFFVWTNTNPVKAQCMECHIKIVVRDDGRPSWPSPFPGSGK
jgi:Zn ribbon nucleic-acid-binding protein